MATYSLMNNRKLTTTLTRSQPNLCWIDALAITNSRRGGSSLQRVIGRKIAPVPVRQWLLFRTEYCDIEIEPNKDALVDWMEKNNIHHSIISFTEAHPAVGAV